MATQMPDITTEIEQIDYEDASSLINHSRDKLATIAEDTLKKLKAGWYCPHNGPRINFAQDIAFCVNNTILYTEDDLNNTEELSLTIDEIDPTSITTATSPYTKFEFRNCTTLQAAQSLVAEMGEDHVGVLNFASAKNPGGGFLRGSSAQEESLARSSSLYLALTQDRIFTEFYGYNRRGKTGLYSHRIIYSPRVTIFKNDNGKLLSSPYHVGMVSSPAPNASVVRDPEAIRNAMTERIKRILYVFKANKHDSLVLGAFGCGVFKNNPLEVAITFRQHLESKEFKNSFKRIIFAILNPDMCHVFKQVFTTTDLNHIQQQIAEIPLNNGNNQRYRYNNQNKQYTNMTTQRRKENSDYKQARDRKDRNYHNYEDDDE